jgi:hypothetical protein
MGAVEDLVVEIFVPHSGTHGAYGEIATGYPVTAELILTAQHVLHPPPGRDPDRPIEVRWRWRGVAPTWHPVHEIAWEDPHWDLALLACTPTPDIDPRVATLGSARPSPNAAWYSLGFPRVGGKRDGDRRPFGMGGRLKAMLDEGGATPVLHLGEVTGPDNADDWKGASGSPVFVQRQLIGVIVAVPDNVRAKRLSAVPLWRLLRDCATFREKIGYRDLAVSRQAAQERLRRHLDTDNAKALRGALCAKLHLPSETPAVLAAALLETPLDEALDALDVVLKGLSAARQSVVRSVVADIVGELLPSLYDPAPSPEWERCPAALDPACLELPAALPTAGEVLMAGLRARPAYFRDLADRDRLPEPRDLLELPPEAGFDDGGAGFVRNVETDLAAQLGLDEEAALVENEADRDAMRDLVRDELDQRAQRRRQYYYMLLDADAATLPAGARAAVQTLKGHYDKLDFGVLALRRDLRTRGRERQRLWLLRELLPCAEEAST